jgi:hypothetical protein
MKLYCHNNCGEVAVNCREINVDVIAALRRWVSPFIRKFASNSNAVMFCLGCARILATGILSEVFVVFLGPHASAGMLIRLIRPQCLPNLA